MNDYNEREALAILEEIIDDTRSAFVRGLTSEEERVIELALDYTININSIQYELSIEEAQYDNGYITYLDLITTNNIIDRYGRSYCADVELVDGYNYILYLKFDDIIHLAYSELWNRVYM